MIIPLLISPTHHHNQGIWHHSQAVCNSSSNDANKSCRLQNLSPHPPQEIDMSTSASQDTGKTHGGPKGKSTKYANLPKRDCQPRSISPTPTSASLTQTRARQTKKKTTRALSPKQNMPKQNINPHPCHAWLRRICRGSVYFDSGRC